MLIEVCESLIRAFMVEAINLLVTIRTVKNQHDKPRLTRPSIQLIASISRLMIQERPRPSSWWKFVFSISMPEKFLPQLPYNERSQSDQGLGIPH
jgi:hypothetical protein